MRKRYVTINAVDVRPGDRFTIGNVTYYVNLTGTGIHPVTGYPYVLIGAEPESKNQLHYVTIDLGELATFTILKK